MPMHIVQVVLDAPIDKYFDYRYQPSSGGEGMPLVGQLVTVPFGRRTAVGLVVGTGDASDVPPENLKDAGYCFQEIPPLGKAWLDLCRFAASYYHRTLGEVALSVLPKMVRQGKQKAIGKALAALAQEQKKESPVPVDMPVLNASQQQAVETILHAEGFFPVLLYGVTGSGKTEVYLRAVAEKLRQSPDAQVLLMVPEINLTPQLEARVRARFPAEDIAVLHSRLSEGQRLRNWLAAVTGTARIILGTRLSVMVPAPNLALIVVDEEHAPSYKQQEGLRYSARDLSVWRANYLKIPVVLGSATPSLESWHHVQTGRYRQMALPERAMEHASYPAVSLIDTSKEPIVDGLTQPLVEAVRRRLAKGEVSLLFLNRRGFAPVITCNACGWVSQCHRCSAYMVYHKAGRLLRCHHCGLARIVPRHCPDCGNLDLQALGRGTQRIEENIRQQFPEARVLRIDADSTSRKGSLQKALEDIYQGKVDIVIGTQMVAKGHDFQNLTLVGVLDPDTALFSHDYRAGERLFSQLMQVAGRAGRSVAGPDANPAQVMIQTRYPGHPLYQAMCQRRYDAYVGELMEERRIAGFPPFGYQALLTAEAKSIDKAMAFLQGAKGLIDRQQGITVSDAIPMAVMRVANVERAQLLLESASRPALQGVLSDWLPKLKGLKTSVKWQVEIDPLSI
ncbi:MAG: primosomal protein N' [Oxalobacter sp.]|nr:primosomal protein N' [Oxalobacter sp.]